MSSLQIPEEIPSPEAQSRTRAREKLPQNAYDYFAGAAGDERTYRENLNAFAEVIFRPRCLVSVTNIDTSTTLPGIGHLASPIIVAPMAFQKMAHPDGELAVANAVRKHRLAMVLSMFSNTSIEDVAAAGPTRLLHIYALKNRDKTRSLIRRAVDTGYKAIVLTVDAPRFGRRERDRKNAFRMPPNLTVPNVDQSQQNVTNLHSTNQSALETVALDFETNLGPETLRWLIDQSPLPIWVKGVVRSDDAMRAVEAGASAIVVSNHGARQLEGAIPTMQALPEVVAGVAGRVPVLIDSGVRSGEDVVRACALGASAVLVGRPVLWALADNGEQGVLEMLDEMKKGVELTMMLCGATSTEKISRDMVTFRRTSKL